MGLVCKICKRDLTDAAKAFRSPAEAQHAHTTAHLRDVVEDMRVVCTHLAVVGWVDREMTLLAQKALGELQIINRGLFD